MGKTPKAEHDIMPRFATISALYKGTYDPSTSGVVWASRTDQEPGDPGSKSSLQELGPGCIMVPAQPVAHDLGLYVRLYDNDTPAD